MSRKPGGTSVDEEKALELYHQGLTDREIGEKLFISGTTICGWRHRRGLPANYSPMYRGKRPEVTVEVPEGLKTVKEREKGEPTNAEPAQEVGQDADGGDDRAPELSPPVDGGPADPQQEDRQNLPPPCRRRGLAYKHKVLRRRLFCRFKRAELRARTGGGGIAPGGS